MKTLQRLLYVSLAAILIFSPLHAWAQTDFTGKWALNKAASDLSGEKAADTITIRQKGDSMGWSEDYVLPGGFNERKFWSGLMDGHSGFVTLSASNHGIASFKPDGSSHWVTRESDTDEVPSLSTDGEHLTIMVVSADRKGGGSKQKLVYDRTK